MVWAEKTISGTYYGSVRPDVDFPILADLDMDKKLNLERPDQPHLQIRRDKRGFSPAGVRLGSARPNRVRLMGRGPYGKTKMQVFVTGASWAPDKGITVVDRKTLDVVGT